MSGGGRGRGRGPPDYGGHPPHPHRASGWLEVSWYLASLCGPIHPPLDRQIEGAHNHLHTRRGFGRAAVAAVAGAGMNPVGVWSGCVRFEMAERAGKAGPEWARGRT